MTACKFPSAWRRNSYRERRSDEQAIYVCRMRTEPTFVTDELLAVLASYVLERRLPVLHAPVPADPPPGWYVQQSRAVRGLEPVDATVPETGVASTGTNATNSESVKASELRPERYIRSLERALGEKDRQFTELETYVRSLEARLAAHHEARAEAERYAASLRQALKEQGQRFREVESYAQSLQEHAAAVEQARGKTETYARSLQRLVDEQEHRLAAAAAAARPVERDAGHECMGESSAPPSDATATAMGQDDPSHRHGT
jgi:hypothetical protein